MINLAVTQLCLYTLEVEPGLGFQVHRVSRLCASLTSASSDFLLYFGQRTKTLHMAVLNIWGECRQAREGEGRKTKQPGRGGDRR